MAKATSSRHGYLLDTHVWLWMNGEPGRLNSRARKILSQPANELYLSAVSAWEIAIKVTAGKLQLPLPVDRYLEERTRTNRVRDLPVTRQHGAHAGTLPLHHRDPFDRMLVAQATIEGLPLLTVDRQLESYDAEVIWAG